MAKKAAPSAIGTSEAEAERRRWRRRLTRALALFGAAALVALLAYGLFTKGPNQAVDERLANGVAPLAPSWTDTILYDGSLPPTLNRELAGPFGDGELSPAELRGTPFVLNFWASWCIPCRQEAPVLESGWRRFGPKGVLFLGLNMQDLTGDARNFINEFDITYPSVREPSNDTAGAYGVTGIPETFFVTAKGRIVGHVIGVVSDEQLAKGVLAAKGGRIVGTEEGGARRPQR